ncbi:hypothetical protein L249_1266 [Ophiocordyceps polyrhachis-furcata BCC 54312]|uniref:Centrosomin N-terminal motif 1 domain-containing protein n=1 Tax=Ophiocordyceps polyrhachis-furcata BCC 54312 TaxID=1330021 RepID=A0A367LCV7_9HYPO|nr:hypothetical protein L249_1266 [Ophiocordyceps polyrhachis-furcata BCC 54312]
MDFVKKAAQSASGSSGNSNNNQQGGEKMDYVDKAFDKVTQKSGHSMDRNTQEKITDAGRQAYENATGLLGVALLSRPCAMADGESHDGIIAKPPPSTSPKAMEEDVAPPGRTPRQVPSPPPHDSSQIGTMAIDESREIDDALSEEAVRQHLNDVESSFLPALSPIATGTSDAAAAGIDDTYLFDSPEKPVPRIGDDFDADASRPEFDSSPTAAAVARSLSRARAGGGDARHHTVIPAVSGRDDAENVGTDDAATGVRSRAESVDVGASTEAPSLRLGRRPNKYLRSRHSSERSSTSSFITNPESHGDSDATVGLGLGLDYALRSGGAVPTTLGTPRVPSNPLLRSTSVGSMASGPANDDLDAAARQLSPLVEIDSRPQTRQGDPNKTPRQPSKDGIDTAPTDTVIAEHVRSVQVPESLAKEYKFNNGLQTPRRPPPVTAGGTASRGGRSLTLKEQSSTIERLSKENFDLKLKVMFLSDRLDKLSEEGIREMISENVDLKTNLAVLQRDNKVLRKRVKELERNAREDDNRPSTARSGTSSTGQASRVDDEEMREREEELIYLRERVEEYAIEIERLRNDAVHRESEKRKLADMVKTSGDRNSEGLGRQEEADVWKDLLEQETARREQADEENRRLRDEVFRVKREASAGGSRGGSQHTTTIYNMGKKPRDRDPSTSRPVSRVSGGGEGESNANFSSATTLVEELRRESEQLRHENAELRREVGAQTSMLTSRNREKERLYQEIEDLKMAQRRHASGSGGGGGGLVAPSTVDSILERSASRAGGLERPHSRGSGKTKLTTADEEDEQREELENRLAEMRDKVSEVRLQNQELQRELESCMEDFETAMESKRQADEAAASLREDVDTAVDDLVALQAERDEALREQGDMEEQFEALRLEAQEEIDALEAEADERNEEVQRVQAELRERSENFDALQEEMRKLSEALVRLEDEQDAKIRRIGNLEGELETANRELEELEVKLLEANEKNQRLAVQQESSQGEIEFLREEQEADKMRIGEVEAALTQAEQGLREERERARELDTRLQQERIQREKVADREKEEVQQVVDELNRDASKARDEMRRLRKNLSSREVEATEWKERLLELENNLREALGDLNGTRSSLLKSIAKLQRELENTVRDLDTTRASAAEKDRIIKQRDSLLESHALESRRVAEMLDKERVAHRNTKAQFEQYRRTNQHLTQTTSTQDLRIAELESSRGQERKRMAVLEQAARDQLRERNELLLTLWQRLSALCGREWINGNALVDRQAVPSVEVIANRLPGFSKNLLAAVKTTEGVLGALRAKAEAVERDLQREYRALEDGLAVRVKKLDRLETMVRNSVMNQGEPLPSRTQHLEDALRQLKVENATLRSAHEARSRMAKSNHPSEAGLEGGAAGSPFVPRGPGDRDRSRSSRGGRGERSSRESAATTTSSTEALPMMGGGMDVALAGGEAAPGPVGSERRWMLRLRDLEFKLRLEREGRNQDRQAARQRLGSLETEIRELRDRRRRLSDVE